MTSQDARVFHLIRQGVGACVVLSIINDGLGLEWVRPICVTIYLLLCLASDQPALRCNLADGMVLACTAWVLISVLWSSYRDNAWIFVNRCVSGCVLYLLLRYEVRQRVWQGILLGAASSAVILALLANTRFAIQYRVLESLHFTELTSLRAWMTLAVPGASPNDLGAMLLLGVGFIMSAAVWAYCRGLVWLCALAVLGVFLNILAVLNLCSRGSTFACVMFPLIAALCGLGIKKIRKRLVIISAITAVSILGSVLLQALVWPQITVSCYSGHTISQQRSFAGRAIVWSELWQLFQFHTLVGVGALNIPLAYPAVRAANNNHVIVGQTFNTYLQVLLEEGIMGTVVFAFAVMCQVRMVWRAVWEGTHESTVIVVVLLTSMIATLIHDITFASLWENPMCGFIAVITLVLIVNSRTSDQCVIGE